MKQEPSSQASPQEKPFIYQAVLKQVKGSADVIGAILIICNFITENCVPVNFEVTRLRDIALHSVDKATSTHLWHINALITASSDIEHLLLAIEMMFEQFLGSQKLFLKEKHKSQSDAVAVCCTKLDAIRSIPFANALLIVFYFGALYVALSDVPEMKALAVPLLCVVFVNVGVWASSRLARETMFFGNEVVSFVNSYYQGQGADSVDEATEERATSCRQSKQAKVDNLPQMSVQNPVCRLVANDENEYQQNRHNNLSLPSTQQFSPHPQQISNASPEALMLRRRKMKTQLNRGLASPMFLNTVAKQLPPFDACALDTCLLSDTHVMETTPASLLSDTVEMAPAPFDLNKFSQFVDTASPEMSSASSDDESSI